MSLELVKQVSREHPDLLPTNLGATCYQHTVFLIQKLRSLGHSAHLICKMAGEGGYTPPDFVPFETVGFDGKRYWIAKVSHDAIYWNGLQVDTLASANEHDRFIYRIPGSIEVSFDPASGPHITASPVWDLIPKEKWRPWNPPYLLDSIPEASPTLPPPQTTQYPPYPPNESDVDGAGVALFADFGMAGQPPNPAMFRFAFRVAYSWLTKEVPDLPASVAKHRKEWRAILGVPPL